MSDTKYCRNCQCPNEPEDATCWKCGNDLNTPGVAPPSVHSGAWVDALAQKLAEAEDSREANFKTQAYHYWDGVCDGIETAIEAIQLPESTSTVAICREECGEQYANNRKCWWCSQSIHEAQRVAPPDVACSEWVDELERAMTHTANALDAWPDDRSSSAYLNALKAGACLLSAVNEARSSSTVAICREGSGNLPNEN